jgi:hypothetical protein
VARHLAPVDDPVFRVLEELTTEKDVYVYAYGPYMTKGAARGQETRLRREQEDYRRLGVQVLRVQSAVVAWKDVE